MRKARAPIHLIVSAVKAMGAGPTSSSGDLPLTWRRLAPTLLVLAVFLMTALVWMSRPAGDTQGAVTQSVAGTGTTGLLTSGTRVSQPVMATEDNLTGFSADFGTYGGNSDCAVNVAVTDGFGHQVSQRRLKCADLVDSNATKVAEFPAISHSAGKVFTVTFSAAPGHWSQFVTLWSGKPESAALPASIQHAGQSDGLPSPTAQPRTLSPSTPHHPPGIRSHWR
jgi:hypothetical protein